MISNDYIARFKLSYEVWILAAFDHFDHVTDKTHNLFLRYVFLRLQYSMDLPLCQY